MAYFFVESFGEISIYLPDILRAMIQQLDSENRPKKPLG